MSSQKTAIACTVNSPLSSTYKEWGVLIAGIKLLQKPSTKSNNMFSLSTCIGVFLGSIAN
jgi:hypothetical protein